MCKNFITTAAACRVAAQAYKNMFSGNIMSEKDRYPRGCFHCDNCSDLSNQYYYNPLKTSEQLCGENGYNCVCNRQACQSCPNGYYSFGGTDAKCVEGCQIGAYCPDLNKPVMIRCPKGKYNNQEGQISCSSCMKGKYNAEEGKKSESSCLFCRKGTYNTKEGQANCVECAPGKYNTKEGQVNETSCFLCEKGKFSAKKGLPTGCRDCNLGTYNELEGQLDCLLCEPGTYENEVGRSICKKCAKGRYNNGKQQISETSCVSCELGKFNDNYGATTCITCKAGKYNEGTGQLDCKLCPRDTYSDRVGRASKNDCKKCEAGKYNDKEGQTSCTTRASIVVLFWIAKIVGIFTALAFVYKIYSFYKLYRDGKLKKKMMSQKLGCFRAFVAFLAFGKTDEVVKSEQSNKSEPLLSSVHTLDHNLANVEMSTAPRQSVCEILDDANLGMYKENFAKVGLRSTNDLTSADEEDLEKAGLSAFERKKLKLAMDKPT
eukprot:g1524.t1